MLLVAIQAGFAASSSTPLDPRCLKWTGISIHHRAESARRWIISTMKALRGINSDGNLNIPEKSVRLLTMLPESS